MGPVFTATRDGFVKPQGESILSRPVRPNAASQALQSVTKNFSEDQWEQLRDYEPEVVSLFTRPLHSTYSLGQDIEPLPYSVSNKRLSLITTDEEEPIIERSVEPTFRPSSHFTYKNLLNRPDKRKVHRIDVTLPATAKVSSNLWEVPGRPQRSASSSAKTATVQQSNNGVSTFALKETCLKDIAEHITDELLHYQRKKLESLSVRGLKSENKSRTRSVKSSINETLGSLLDRKFWGIGQRHLERKREGEPPWKWETKRSLNDRETTFVFTAHYDDPPIGTATGHVEEKEVEKTEGDEDEKA
jgi:hypothetical protein